MVQVLKETMFSQFQRLHLYHPFLPPFLCPFAQPLQFLLQVTSLLSLLPSPSPGKRPTQVFWTPSLLQTIAIYIIYDHHWLSHQKQCCLRCSSFQRYSYASSSTIPSPDRPGIFHQRLFKSQMTNVWILSSVCFGVISWATRCIGCRGGRIVFWGQNTNSIQLFKNERIRIQILLRLKKSTKYEYFYYSV